MGTLELGLCLSALSLSHLTFLVYARSVLAPNIFNQIQFFYKVDYR